MKKIFILALPILLIACSNDDKKAEPQPTPDVPLAKSKNSGTFNVSYKKLLSSYYELQAAFVTEDTTAIAKAAVALKIAADSLPLKQLSADSLIIETAQQGATNIADEVTGLLGEKDLENKRKSFEIITNHLSDLTRTVQYDESAVYVIHCPMAFNNKGADWLSNSMVVKNPYLPKSMPSCGEVKDSIDYRQK